MQDQGLISGYTLRQNNAKRHFITVFMHSPAFSEFEAFLAATEEVEAAYKTTGEGCYLVIWLESETHTLEAFSMRYYATANTKSPAQYAGLNRGCEAKCSVINNI